MKSTTVFNSGNSQAVRVPKDFRFSGEKVLIEKIGAVTILIDEGSPWASLKLAQALISTDFFKEGRGLNEIQERKELEDLFKK